MNQPDSSVDQMKKPLSGSRKGILVLGMHRSGTSALTRVLHLLGCQLPKQVMGGGVGNELGHWESVPIVSFNDEVLVSAGTSWDDWLPFNSDWYQSPVVRDFVSRGRTLLTEEFGTSPLFVLKDPRICRIANFWLEIFAAEGIEPAVVVPVRNPLEVGNSLNERDMMEPGYAHLLWLRHILDAEIASRGLKRVFCTYDQLLEDWPGLADRMKMTLGITWPRISASTAVEISSFLTTEQRHYASSPKLTGFPISEWISGAYAIALRWSNSGETESDFRILDSIRAELDAASPAFAHLLLPRSRSGMAGDGSRRRAELEAQLSDTEARLNAAEAGLRSARQDYENESAQEFNRLGDKIADSQRELERLANNEQILAERLAQSEALQGEKTAQLEAAASRVDELAVERDALGHRLADVESTLRQREEEVAQARAELSTEREAKAALQGENTAQLEAAASRLDELAAERDALGHRLADVESTLRQREEEVAQVWAELSIEREAKAALQAEAVQLAGHADQQLRKLEEAEAWVFKLAEDRQMAEGRAATFSAALTAERRGRAAAESALQRFEAQLQATIQRELDTARGVEEAQLRNKMLSESLVRAEARSSDLEQQIASAKERYGKLSVELDLAHGERISLAKEIGEHGKEIAVLTQQLRHEEIRAVEQAKRVEWFAEVSRVLMINGRWWWALMPRSWRRRRELRRLSRRGLFDSEMYLTQYPDVTTDPLQHYITHGMAEGRTCAVPDSR